MKDAIVEEIRSFRDAHARKFNYDIDAICEDFKAHQTDCGHPIVRLEPKKPDGKATERISKRRRTSEEKSFKKGKQPMKKNNSFSKAAIGVLLVI